MRALAQKSVAKKRAIAAAVARGQTEVSTRAVAPSKHIDSTMRLAWTKEAGESSKKFVRGLTITRRHKNRKLKENAQAAEGCAKIDSMFARVPSDTDQILLGEIPVADELTPEGEYQRKVKKAIDELAIFTTPVVNAKS